MAKKALKRVSVRLDPDNASNLKDYCRKSILMPSVAKVANYLIRHGYPSLLSANDPKGKS